MGMAQWWRALIRPPAAWPQSQHQSGLAPAVAPSAAHGQRRLQIQPSSLGWRTKQRGPVPTESPFAAGRRGIDPYPSNGLTQQAFEDHFNSGQARPRAVSAVAVTRRRDVGAGHRRGKCSGGSRIPQSRGDRLPPRQPVDQKWSRLKVVPPSKTGPLSPL